MLLESVSRPDHEIGKATFCQQHDASIIRILLKRQQNKAKALLPSGGLLTGVREPSANLRAETVT